MATETMLTYWHYITETSGTTWAEMAGTMATELSNNMAPALSNLYKSMGREDSADVLPGEYFQFTQWPLPIG